MSNSKKIVGILVVLLALVALGGAALAFAQESQTLEEAVPEQEEISGARPGLIRLPRFLRDRMPDALANALGITVEELRSAQEEAQATVLEQAVEEGLIAQERADLLLGLAELKRSINPEEIVASALGISVDELQTARDEGKTLRQLVEELELEPAEVREAFRAAREEAIQQAVEEEVISQEVADQILSRPRLGSRAFRGFHRGHGFRGLRGFGPVHGGSGPVAPSGGA